LETAQTGTIYTPFKVSALTPTSATVEWRTNEVDITSYRAELQVLSLTDSRDLRISWTTHPHFTTTPGDRCTVGRLEQLQAATPYTVRIIPIYGNGEPGDALFEAAFRTPAKQVNALRKSASWLGVGTLLLAGGAVWWYFRRRRSGSL
jgi:hypothetical protein